ncbi:NAD(P)-binding domain-containing protein [Saccharopolyspora tripterygii]
MNTCDAIVIGGGQSGLAAAHALRTQGHRPVVLEAGAEPVGSWPRYYDSLTLYSPARFSAFPEVPFPGDPDRYPHRDEVVDYLRRYAHTLDADIRTHHRVSTVTADNGTYTVHTEHSSHTAPIVIAASGGFSRPHRPTLPGLDTFDGTLVHTADYRNPEPFAGQRIVIVGGGNAAVQIAVELAEHADVTLTNRKPLRFVNPTLLGKDMHYWTATTRLDILPIGPWLRTIPPHRSPTKAPTKPRSKPANQSAETCSPHSTATPSPGPTEPTKPSTPSSSPPATAPTSLTCNRSAPSTPTAPPNRSVASPGPVRDSVTPVSNGKPASPPPLSAASTASPLRRPPARHSVPDPPTSLLHPATARSAMNEHGVGHGRPRQRPLRASAVGFRDVPLRRWCSSILSMGRSVRRSVLGPLEAEVMAVLWQSGSALRVREVLAELNSDRDSPLAYTTVMTVLSRLAERGVARRESAGRGYAYLAAVGNTAEIAVRRLLDDYGEAALVSFVDHVSEDDELRERLRRLVDEP